MFILLVIIVVFLLLAAIPHLIWLMVWCVGHLFGFDTPYAPFGWSVVALVVTTLLILAYGYAVGRWKLDVNRIEYAHKEIPPSFDGYRIVHISDMHLASFVGHEERLDHIVDVINEQKPDVVCFTGDIVSRYAEEVRPFVDVLRHIKATDGVMSVLGNHDFMIYAHNDNAEMMKKSLDTLTRLESDTLGWTLLRNANTVIHRGDEKITFIGVDNQKCSGQGFKTIAKGDLKKAAKGCDGFRILLSHDPSHWNGEVLPDSDIPLTLSGHTHAAQCRLFGWSLANVLFDYSAGRYDHGGQTLYINVGLGCTIPCRIGANPEITLITLGAK